MPKWTGTYKLALVRRSAIYSRPWAWPINDIHDIIGVRLIESAIGKCTISHIEQSREVEYTG